jgi:hypothetical protein
MGQQRLFEFFCVSSQESNPDDNAKARINLNDAPELNRVSFGRATLGSLPFQTWKGCTSMEVSEQRMASCPIDSMPTLQGRADLDWACCRHCKMPPLIGIIAHGVKFGCSMHFLIEP